MATEADSFPSELGLRAPRNIVNQGYDSVSLWGFMIQNAAVSIRTPTYEPFSR